MRGWFCRNRFSRRGGRSVCCQRYFRTGAIGSVLAAAFERLFRSVTCQVPYVSSSTTARPWASGQNPGAMRRSPADREDNELNVSQFRNRSLSMIILMAIKKPPEWRVFLIMRLFCVASAATSLW